MSWKARARCKGQPINLFFYGSNGDPRPAKALCARCPVQRACLEDALATEDPTIRPSGIRGGLTGKERERLREREVA